MTRPRVMGVLNVTPDSFSDGGLWADPEVAIAHGFELIADGADIIDVGGESTRPGATRPVPSEELGRVLPVITALAESGATVSVDTMRADVAAAALEAGATIVNDVSGGLADPAMLELLAGSDATYVVMHWRAHADRMADFATYGAPGGPDGIVATVRDELARRLDAVTAAGVDPERVVLDPGLGFAKVGAQNFELLRGLDALLGLGRPLLVGASRKSFLGALLADAHGPRRVDRREHANTALTLWLAERGVWGVRVHDARAARDALAVWEALSAPDGAAP